MENSYFSFDYMLEMQMINNIIIKVYGLHTKYQV